MRDPRVNCRRAPVDDHTIDTDQWHNVVDRSFDVSKQWRALATQYDKPALTYYRRGVALRAITI